MKIEEIGEFGLIDRIKAIVNGPSGELVVGIEDDCAVVRWSDDKVLLLTTDTLIQGIHFNLDYFTFYQIGWRAVAANLSDIAAMGGWPRFVLATLALPKDTQVESVEEMYAGMKALADRFETSIVGGDTTASEELLVVSLTVVGQVEPDKLTRRSAAQIGDAVFVTGTLGGAQAGLTVLKAQKPSLVEQNPVVVGRHLTPEPRIREARFLVENFDIHAMIDISDGLASETHHVCKNSAVGALLLQEAIPLDSQTRAVAALFNENALDYALCGGEDYELLFTAPPEIASDLSLKFYKEFSIPCTKIGKIVASSAGVRIETGDGRRTSLSARGYDHFHL